MSPALCTLPNDLPLVASNSFPQVSQEAKHHLTEMIMCKILPTYGI